MDQSIDGTRALAQAVGEFGGMLLLAFLLSRLGFYIRRSSRYEPGTVAGVHVLCFFFLGLVACSNPNVSGSPGLTAFFAQLTMFLIDYCRLPDPDEYRDDQPQRPGTIKPLGFVLIAGALLLGIGATLMSERPVSDETLAADVERGMASTEGGRLYLDGMKRNFPDEHRAMVASMVRQVRGNGTRGFTPEFQRRVEQDVASQLEALIVRHQPAVGRAPANRLNALARASRDFVLQAQKEAPGICAAYALGAPTADQLKAMPESMRLPAARMTVAMLDAAKAGLDNPVPRDVSTPPQAIIRLTDRVRAELGPSLGPTVDNPAAMAARSVADRCRIAATYYATLTTLPPEDSAAVTAYNFAP